MSQVKKRIGRNGCIQWWTDDAPVVHRETTPAIIFADGETIWMRWGLFSRDDETSSVVIEAGGRNYRMTSELELSNGRLNWPGQ